MKDSITFITGLWDIKRGDAPESFRRDFKKHYLPNFKELLKLDINLIIYCNGEVETFVWEHRKQENTHVIRREKEFFQKGFDFFQQVQNIRNNEGWKSQAGWLRESPQSSLEYYNPIVFSKFFMLHDCCIINPFGTENFFWIDAGLSNTVNISKYLSSKDNINKLSNLTDKLLFLSFPYDGQVEVHGFNKTQLNQYAEQNTEYVCRGGFFGGKPKAIKSLNSVYYELLRETLNSGLMGTEESIFTILSYTHSSDIDRVMINPNGLIGTFFENLEKDEIVIDKPKQIIISKRNIYTDLNECKIYVLTFNSPNQLTLLLENWERTMPDLLTIREKILINNSTERKFDAEYEEIAKKYNFTIKNFNNIGICGARQWVAEDFNESDKDYYIFFEDDMLFYEINKLCPKGLPTQHEDFLKKAFKIIKYENLDFLKLSFSEFFGDNSQQWAFTNIPKKIKDTYYKGINLVFPKDYDKIPYVKTDYINSIEGLSYSCGEYYYCNWPLIFTKEGNKKLFLDVTWQHPYEQTWMSQCFQLQKKNVIKSGVLLLSPINHTRKYFYKAEVRREN